MIFKSFKAASVKAIRTESRVRTYAYVIQSGISVVCPPATNFAFLRKFSSILTSNINWHLISWYVPSISSTVPSHSSKAGRRFFISMKIESHHRVLPFFLSIVLAWLKLLGISIPYLWVRTQYFDLTLEMIWLRFFNTYGAHYAYAGSNKIRFSTAYSADWTG